MLLAYGHTPGPNRSIRVASSDVCGSGGCASQFLLQFRALGARTDQAHLAVDDVEQLGQFINPHAPSTMAPYSRDALVAGFCPADRRIGGLNRHCSQLI